MDYDAGGEGEAPALHVLGGKITTYRHLAAEAVSLLQPRLPMMRGGDWTATAPLPGGDFPMTGLPALLDGLARDYPFLDAATIDRIGRAYGTCARQWLGDARSMADLGVHFAVGFTQAEAAWQMDREWARTADDMLWRRTKLGLRFTAADVTALEQWVKDRG